MATSSHEISPTFKGMVFISNEAIIAFIRSTIFLKGGQITAQQNALPKASFMGGAKGAKSPRPGALRGAGQQSTGGLGP